MKSIMYHYVRDYNSEYPSFIHLSKDKFINQIKNFQNNGIIENENEIFNFNKKYILTFDDGFKDHLYVAEELKKRNYIGIFFIPTLPYKNKTILDVHKAHLITGKMGGTKSLNMLFKYLKDTKEDKFLNIIEKEKFKSAYKNQNDEEDKKEFKRIINYYGDVDKKKLILNYLLKIFEINVSITDFYLTEKEIKYISDIGMIIGSHGVSHTLLSRLSYEKQKKELKESKKFLENITNKKCKTFCYPYGGKISYNNNTLNILKELDYEISFSVESRDITLKDLKDNKYELPRYDCNQFIISNPV
jgi:peptidoglycan/xylan/chitin deacetylase (PgdA/CDA1 family)